MGNKLTLYIVRHGRTLMNQLEKVQGWCDSPLTSEGTENAHFLGLGLKNIHFDSAYCSTSRRTRITTEVILAAKGQEELRIVEMDGLKEAGFGSFESGSTDWMWESAAYYLHYNQSSKMSKDVLSGKLSYHSILNAIKELDKVGMAEGYEEVETRTQNCLQEIAQTEYQKGSTNVLIVSHGMSIITMLWSLGGKDLMNGIVENSSVCQVVYENGIFTVKSMNDLSYLKNGKASIT